MEVLASLVVLAVAIALGLWVFATLGGVLAVVAMLAVAFAALRLIVIIVSEGQRWIESIWLRLRPPPPPAPTKDPKTVFRDAMDAAQADARRRADEYNARAAKRES